MGDSADDETRHDRPSRPSLRKSTPADPEFGPRYNVIGKLGKGGMGEVYRAFDTELNGEVALKIVREDVDVEIALARFRREIALARKVTSPNVLRVYDLNEHQGLRFLSMEFVDGEDLAKLMRREGKLPLERALAIFRQICDGLGAAHTQGVVHRDLKPQNVLVGKGDHVRIADFGLARLAADPGMTATGELLGTPAYMSPEQVKGEPTDGRSDLYSLGIILYQLVSGNPPFQGDTPHAVMEMRLHKRPPPLVDTTPGVAPYLDRIIQRCLQIDPSDRYHAARDIIRDLDGRDAAPVRRSRRGMVAVAAVAVVGAGVAYVAWPDHGGRTAPPAPAPAVATQAASDPPAARPIKVLVLGFENRTGDPVFDSTLATLVHGSLRRSPQLDPIATTRLGTLANVLGSEVQIDDQLPARLAAKQHARVLGVHGKIAVKGAGFAISIVVRDSDGKLVLERSVDAAQLADTVAATAKLGAAVRETLGEKVPAGEATQHGLSPQLEADHEFAVGVAMLDVNDLVGAVTHLERAVVADPEFGAGHAVLSIAYSNSARPMDAAVQQKLALRWIDRMDERDRLRFLGDYYFTATEEYDRAILELQQLVTKWPEDVGGLAALAIAYQANGNIDKAIEVGRQAAQCDPRFVAARANVPIYEILGGQFERALADLDAVVKDFARPPIPSYMYMAIASLFVGKRDAAVAALGKLHDIDASYAVAAQADFALSEARLQDAAKLLDQGIHDDLAASARDGAEVKREMLAELCLRRGDKAGARAAAALVTSEAPRVFEAALVQLAVGDDKRALAAAARFGGDVAPSRRALAKMIEAEVQRVHGKPVQAMATLQEALHLNDQPFGHYLRARAALDAKQYADAESELQVAIRRRAEAAFGTDDLSTYRNIPPFTFYLAEAQRRLGNPEAAKTYRAFLDLLHDPDPTDPLVAAARKYAVSP